MSKYKLQELPPEREPILPPEALAYADKCASDPELARGFLQRAGILDENGHLASQYVIEE